MSGSPGGLRHTGYPASVDWLLVLLVGTSVVDRAGVPYSLLLGLVRVGTVPGPATAFVAACILAGALGDLGCYAIGARWLRGHVPPIGADVAPGASRAARVLAYLRPLRVGTARWLVAGKISNAANLAITCGAGAIGFGPWRTLGWCLAASACWIGLIGWGAYHAIAPLRALSPPAAMALGTGWALFLFVVSRIVDRRLRRRVDRAPAHVPVPA